MKSLEYAVLAMATLCVTGPVTAQSLPAEPAGTADLAVLAGVSLSPTDGGRPLVAEAVHAAASAVLRASGDLTQTEERTDLSAAPPISPDVTPPVDVESPTESIPADPQVRAGYDLRVQTGRRLRLAQEGGSRLGGEVAETALNLMDSAPLFWRREFAELSPERATDLLEMPPGGLGQLAEVTARREALEQELSSLSRAIEDANALARRSRALWGRARSHWQEHPPTGIAEFWFGVWAMEMYSATAHEAVGDALVARQRIAYLDAATDYLEGTETELRQLTERQAQASELGLQNLENEIDRSRQRLDQEAIVTQRVEAEAEAAQRRAAEEQAHARDQRQREVADQWSLVAPQLGAVAGRRRREEARLNLDAQQKAAFIDEQGRISRRIQALQESSETDTTRAERADRLYDELLAQRQDARESGRLVRAELSDTRLRLVALETMVENASGRLELAQDEVGLDPDLRRSLVGLRQAEFDLAQAELELEQLRHEVVSAQWRLTELRIYFYAQSTDQLVPMLSGQRRNEAHALTGANLLEAQQNTRDRLIGISLVARDRIERLDDMTTWLSTTPGMVWLSKLLLLAFGVFLALGVIRRRGDAWLEKQVVSRLGKIVWLQRHLLGALKTVELFRVALPLLGLLYVVELVAGTSSLELPELQLLHETTVKLIGMVLALALARCIFLPASLRTKPDEQAPGFRVDLFNMPERTARLLHLTFKVWVVFAAVASILVDATQFLFGIGFTGHLVSRLVFWAQIVMVYVLCFAWRNVIIERFTKVTRIGSADPADEPTTRRVIEALQRHKDRLYSVLYLAILAVYLLAQMSWRFARKRLAALPLARRLEAQLMRRRIEAATSTGEAPKVEVARGLEISQAYRDVLRTQGPLEPKLRVLRNAEYREAMANLGKWLEGGRVALAVLGEEGAGKSTLLDVVQERAPANTSVVRARPATRIVETRELVEFIAGLLSVEGAVDVDSLVDGIRSGPRQVVLLDDCQRVFLRTVDGFEALDSLLQVISLTADWVGWFVVFELHAWEFLNRVHDRRQHFTKLLELGPISSEDVQLLIESRNEKAGVHADFRTLATAGRMSTSENRFELVRTARGFYRMLTEFTGGIPELALLYWERSLKPRSARRVEVGLFAQPDDSAAQQLGEREMFALTALVQHGALTGDELARVVGVSEGLCDVDLEFLQSIGLVNIRDNGRASVSMLAIRPVLNRLQLANLLFTRRT